MQIRKMTIEDYEAVYNLWISTPGMGLNKTDDSKDGIGKYLKRNPDTCFVAVNNGEVIGVIMSGHDGRRGFIYHTAVKDCEQNCGIGSALLDTAVNALLKEGISNIALLAFKNNQKGNIFWEKRGFLSRDDLIYRNRSIKEIERIDT